MSSGTIFSRLKYIPEPRGNVASSAAANAGVTRAPTVASTNGDRHRDWRGAARGSVREPRAADGSIETAVGCWITDFDPADGWRRSRIPTFLYKPVLPIR